MSLAAWGEFILIGTIALMILDPKDLPKILYHLGRFVGQLQRFWHTMQNHIEDISHLGEAQSMADEQKSDPKEPE